MEPRFLGPAHADRLAALHADGFDAPWDAAEFAALLDQPGVFAIALGEAFVLCRVVADEAEILTIATAPAARRLGLGRRLVEAACAFSHAQGAVAMLLEVAADNAPAQALYAATGFEPVGRRRGYYARPGAAPVDALVLRRPLNT